MQRLAGNVNARFNTPKIQYGLTMIEKSLGESFDLPRVLVADNDPLTSQLLTSLSEKDGYRVVSVSDGREAYRVLKSDADFKIAIFNMMMPHLEGVDIVRYMKTEKRLMRIPVVVVGGEQGLRTVSESFAAGAIAFLSKPFNAELLQRTLRLALGGCATSREIQRAA